MEGGLSAEQVIQARKRFGSNELVAEGGRHRLVFGLLARFRNPLVLLLLAAATLSLSFGDKASFVIIITIVLLSVVLDFLNSFRSQQAAEALKRRVQVRVKVRRGGEERLVLAAELVPGDVVVLEAGRVVPADGEMLGSQDLFTNEAALTGESFPQQKAVGAKVFMGSGVVSGAGTMKVTATGKGTQFAHIASDLQSRHRPTEFEHEISQFSVLIVKLTFVLVVFILVVNVLFHRDLLQSILFALALAVGLTPELLPLIITLNLTKGSLRMAKQGVIVKQLSAVQNFGSMDVLCTDKTGTLTEDHIALVLHVDGAGDTSQRVLQLGYVVSHFSSGFSNPLDEAVKRFEHIDVRGYEKLDELPFDFERKRQAVVVRYGSEHHRLLVVQGAPEELMKLTVGLKPSEQRQHQETYDKLSQDGFRVLAVGSKRLSGNASHLQDHGLTFEGFLAFLDPAKQSVSATLKRMEKLGITIKIITGDNALVTEKITREIDLPVTGVLTGEQVAAMSAVQLRQAVQATTIFARVNPEQKLAIITALQQAGHVVGYLGDGINDAPSLRAADVGISVNNAVDVAKDAADFILLRKNLGELVQGVVEGRKTFANTMKYLRMSLSSNFGNMFSMAAASLFLPFLPMLATQILLNNLLYDSSQFALPLDNVDEAEVLQPRTLSLIELKRFMWCYGALSSAFDFVTFGVLLFVFGAGQASFQAGWFVESVVTQVLVVYIIRTRFNIWKGSRPAGWLIFSTLAVCAAAITIVLSPIGHWFSFGHLGLAQLALLGLIVMVYLMSAELLKLWFYRGLASAPKLQPSGKTA